jgi:L-threonylcarbamoyladenylate synthase
VKTEIGSSAAEAVALLKAGEVVALPTETVYGLAADALRPEAVAKIFEVKERPHFDPLILHLPDQSWLERIANVPTQEKEIINRLIAEFWPGPFTIVLPKREIVPDIATAGLDTVAVRISAHPLLAEIIRAFGKPLAAPSANRFGRISPTRPEHVVDDLGGRIPLVVDGGPTTHGIESTIVAVRGNQVEILRRGPITEEQLISKGFQPMSPTADKGIVAPGQLPSHYAPRTPLLLTDDVTFFASSKEQSIGLLAWKTAQKNYSAVRTLSESADLMEAATNLFRYLRELDSLELDLIVAEQVPEKGLGRAINDRLRRASGGTSLFRP